MAAQSEVVAERYRLDRLVGSGGMGLVWEAWDLRLERRVALKQLRPPAGLSATEEVLASERAMREARITARLHHRYAVPVFDVIEHDGQPCLIMQFVPSMTLAAVLEEGGCTISTALARVEQTIGQSDLRHRPMPRHYPSRSVFHAAVAKVIKHYLAPSRPVLLQDARSVCPRIVGGWLSI